MGFPNIMTTQKQTMPTLLRANTHSTNQQAKGVQLVLSTSACTPIEVLSFMSHQYPLN
jgi:LysM repeat protein